MHKRAEEELSLKFESVCLWRRFSFAEQGYSTQTDRRSRCTVRTAPIPSVDPERTYTSCHSTDRNKSRCIYLCISSSSSPPRTTVPLTVQEQAEGIQLQIRPLPLRILHFSNTAFAQPNSWLTRVEIVTPASSYVP